MKPKTIAARIADVAKDKKADDIVIMNIQKVSDIAYYFVICTANSVPHAKALAEEIEKKTGKPGHIEGYSYANWILLDYINVVVHIFLKPVREYYKLENIFGDVPIEKVE
ncbi:MAG: ribosome silencing factor [bacterium]|nr:ribosome silencing factor [bacterium]